MTLLLTRGDLAALLTLDDCIGVAIEDVGAAAAVYEKALRAGRGLSADLGR
jgi:ornithine cyclodeaminase/alanine dehydrogenase-like protein (mu-crystallin family)